MNLIGARIVDVVNLSKEIIGKEGWGDSPYSAIGIVLDNGAVIYASQDEEGNGPGAIFVYGKDKETYFILPPDNIE